MIKSVLLLSALSVVLVAQPPPPAPPKLPESFIAKYAVLRPKQQAFLNGNGDWIRDFDGGRAAEVIDMKYTTHEVHREHIRLFDFHKEYAIQFSTNGSVANCTESPIPDEQVMPKAWDWLEESHFSPYHEPGQNVTRDSWITYERNGSIRLVVREEEPETPYLLIRVDHAGDEDQWEFILFEERIPPKEMFDPPTACMTRKHLPN